MEHWFDSLTRRLADQTVDRRTMFSWTAKLGLAAGIGLLGRGSAIASAAPTTAQSGTSTCTVDDTYGVLRSVVTTSVSSPKNPLTITHQFYAEVGTDYSTSILTVMPASVTAPKSAADVLVRLATTSTTKGGRSADAAFGPLYTGAGVRRASFRTDGRTLEGAIDAREIKPVPLGTPPKSLTFRDGQQPGLDFDESRTRRVGPPAPSQPNSRPENSPTPTPSVRIAPWPNGNPSNAATSSPTVAPVSPADSRRPTEIEQAVKTALGSSRPKLSSCEPSPTLPPALATCTRCQLTCREAWLTCSLQAAESSLAAGPLAPLAYLNAAAATCDDALQQCFQTCKQSGACCPDYCKGNADCCASSWGCGPPSPYSRRAWSRAWPTCPRCGPPPWSEATAPMKRQTSPRSRSNR